VAGQPETENSLKRKTNENSNEEKLKKENRQEKSNEQCSNPGSQSGSY